MTTDPKPVTSTPSELKWSDEEIRQKVLTNAQIENPNITYEDIWGEARAKLERHAMMSVAAESRANIAEAKLAETETELKEARAQVEQLTVQLSGCGVAALGWSNRDPAKCGDYGWSASYQDVVNLRAEADRLGAKLDAIRAVVREQKSALDSHGVEWSEQVPFNSSLFLFLRRLHEVIERD